MGLHNSITTLKRRLLNILNRLSFLEKDNNNWTITKVVSLHWYFETKKNHSPQMGFV
jgi:hypothetical protein